MHRRRAVTRAGCALLIGCVTTWRAAELPAQTRSTVRPITFWSQSLGVQKRALVWLPPSYDSDTARRYPVAYYLHGLYGNETNWSSLGRLDLTLDSLVKAGMSELIVVMPDGDDGWYTTWNTLGDYAACRRDFVAREGETVDSYCVPWLHYDDYIARDLVRAVDSTFRTRADRRARAVAGLSMGGYGAVSLAFAYPDVFSAAASHSGVLSPLLTGVMSEGLPRYAESVDELRSRFGRNFPMIGPAFGPDTAAWWSRDPARRVARVAKRDRAILPALMIDIGTEDGLLEQNRAFRSELSRLGVPHRYAEWPGKHDWDYWRRRAPSSLRWIAERIGESL